MNWKKVKQLETVVHSLTRKVLSLEEEMTEIKKNNKDSEGVKGSGQSLKTEDKHIDEMKDIPDENSFKPIQSSSPKDKIIDSQSNFKKDKVKKIEVQEDLFSCTKCKYKAKKEATLKKHIVTQHDNHACKECQENLPSFMELLKHVAKHHGIETLEVKDFEDSNGKDIQNEQIIDEEKSDKANCFV